MLASLGPLLRRVNRFNASIACEIVIVRCSEYVSISATRLSCLALLNRAVPNKVCGTNIRSTDKVDKGIDPVEIKVKDEDGEREQVRKTVDELIKKEKLDPSQIVLLGKHPLKKSIFGCHDKIGKYNIIESQTVNGHKNKIRYSSVYRFKGLEADCVLFTGINSEPRSDIEEDLRSILFTGGSRAKMLLYLFSRI